MDACNTIRKEKYLFLYLVTIPRNRQFECSNKCVIQISHKYSHWYIFQFIKQVTWSLNNYWAPQCNFITNCSETWSVFFIIVNELFSLRENMLKMLVHFNLNKTLRIRMNITMWICPSLCKCNILGRTVNSVHSFYFSYFFFC